MPSYIERDYLDPDEKTLQPDSISADTTNRVFQAQPAENQINENDQKSASTHTAPSPNQAKNTTNPATTANIQIHKKPKNIILCGDGYLEEYSTDEEELTTRKQEEENNVNWNRHYIGYDNTVATNTLNWGHFTNYHFWRNIRRMQWAGYSFGSFFAELMGITGPRFGSEMRAAERMQEDKLRQEELVKQCYVGPDGQLIEGARPDGFESTNLPSAVQSASTASPRTQAETIPINIKMSNLDGGDGCGAPASENKKYGGVRDDLSRKMAESAV